jgi:hypothetical protein
MVDICGIYKKFLKFFSRDICAATFYIRKFDRLLGRTSWKFLQTFGDCSDWALHLLPEFPRMETPSELAFNEVCSADHRWILRRSLRIAANTH